MASEPMSSPPSTSSSDRAESRLAALQRRLESTEAVLRSRACEIEELKAKLNGKDRYDATASRRSFYTTRAR